MPEGGNVQKHKVIKVIKLKEKPELQRRAVQDRQRAIAGKKK
jgi:hypothetical protein